MITRISALSAIAALALGTATFAQETATEEDKSEAPADLELNMGEDSNTPEIGQTYVRETEGDWEIRCIRVAEGQTEPCQMFQLLKDTEGNPVAQVAIFRLPDGGQAVAGAEIAVPLGTALQAQLRIAVDGGQDKRYPYSVCDPLGCLARVGLTAGDIASFKKGAKASVTLMQFGASDKKIELGMSLSGFTASYDKATVVSQ